MNEYRHMSTVIECPETPRLAFGIARLEAAAANVNVSLVISLQSQARDHVPALLPSNAYVIRRTSSGSFHLIGADDTGLLYACLDLAERFERGESIPSDFHLTRTPQFTLRGPAIGMQKTFILPGRKVYEYPYRPDLFPWFYDRAYWTTYLDTLLKNRFNALFLWAGHPFASLLKLPDYPYAQEVDDDTLARNVEMFHFITSECDKRGIWFVQKFYNILLPEGFAKHHNCDTQLAAPTPEAADYTRKSVAAFVKEYPNVGLMVCLGEALQTLELQRNWCTDVILAGIKNGMKLAGLKDEPPVVIRTHATNARVIMPAALSVYRNLYTEAKYNGESLTTHEPRGVRQALHRDMSALGSTHLINVHILANLEPFRYGSVRFIKKCMQAARERFGASGIHLYPLAFWSWPDAPDDTSPRLKQTDRDWIWFEAWARYAWDPYVDEAEDHAYWIDRLTDVFGTSEAAEQILIALNDAGECAPRLLRRYGITEGNRQTMSLGMTLDQLVNPARAKPFPELWESQSPPGERLEAYVDREVKGLPHEGETPPQINEEVLRFAASAVDAIDRAEKRVTNNRAEYERIRNDCRCIEAMSQNYVAKAQAAACVLRYGHSKHVAEMEAALVHLRASLVHFRTLEALTRETYRFANTMQTSQRRVPVPGGFDGQPANYRWSQLLPVYETELIEFEKRVERLLSGETESEDESAIERLPKKAVKLLSSGFELYEANVGARVWNDRPEKIESIAPELAGLNGIRVSDAFGASAKQLIELDALESMNLLVGYVQDADPRWLKVPDLETDAPAAEFVDVEPAIENAVAIRGLPPVHVHVWRVPAGKSTLDLRTIGSFMILGIAPQSAEIKRRDAKRGVSPSPPYSGEREG